MSEKRPRVAFVVHRYHPQIGGGAERHCGLIARHLANDWDCEIITTAADDYRTWADHHPVGLDTSGDVPVRRFPVDRPRDYPAFDRLSPRVLDHPHTDADEAEWIDAQGPVCSRLLEHISQHSAGYDLFIFFTYLYWTTVRGLPAVAEKAWLVPTAHDEKPIYLSAYERLFRAPRAILYNTDAELDFCARRFAQRAPVEMVVGCGVDPPAEPDDENWRRTLHARGVEPPYVLYLGRVDPAKGCDALIATYRRLLDSDAHWPPLVLVGPVTMAVPPHPRIVAVGLVDEATKSAALSDAALLVQPSPFESLSLVLLEAWQALRPVLVNGRCEVLRRQAIAAGGGLYYDSDAEFREALLRLVSRPRDGDAMGRAGRAFVGAHYTWSRIRQAYLELYESLGVPAERTARNDA